MADASTKFIKYRIEQGAILGETIFSNLSNESGGKKCSQYAYNA